MKNITIVGVGYEGLVSGACFADLGNRVTCLDINEKTLNQNATWSRNNRRRE